MTELVFLLEERSIEEVLRVLVPRVVPKDIVCRFIPHEGKSDLEKSIPRKLRAWRKPGVRFVVVRDKDSADCHDVKANLVRLCREGGRPNSLVRVVCPHLEAWYLGDLAAVEAAFGVAGLARRQRQARFRDPDEFPDAEQALRRLVPRYQKISGSRRIAPHLDIDANRSRSFRVFFTGLQRLVEERPSEG